MIRLPLRSAVQHTIAILFIAAISIVIGYISTTTGSSVEKLPVEKTLAMAD